MLTYEQKKEKHRNYMRQWNKDNPEKVRMQKEKSLKKYPNRAKEKRAYIKDKYGIGAGTVFRYGFKLALKIYDKCNRQCVVCGSKNDLTIHHLDGKGRNYKERGLKPNNNENNLVLMCRKCHGRIHGKDNKKSYLKKQ